MRFVRILTITILTLFVLLALSIFIVSKFYEGEVKAYFTEQINKQLNTVVIVSPDDISLSLLRNFPYGALEFDNLVAMDAIKGSKDTLLAAERLSLQFNILDIFRKNYSVKRLAVNNARLNIRYDKQGHNNFSFWKTDGDTTLNRSNVSFNLEKILLSKISFTYSDERSSLKHELFVSSAFMGGMFMTNSYDLSAEADITVGYLSSKDNDLLKDKKLGLILFLHADGDNYTITETELSSGDIKLDLKGSFINIQKGVSLDIQFTGDQLRTEKLRNLLSESQTKLISDYRVNGSLDVNGWLKGASDKTISYHIAFKTKNTSLKQISTDVLIDELALEGLFTNENASKNLKNELKFNNLSAVIGGGEVSGKTTIKFRNDDHIELESMLNLKSKLADLSSFLKLDTLYDVYGEVELDAVYQGLINPAKGYDAEQYRRAKVAGDLVISSAGFKIKESHLAFDELNGQLMFANNTVNVAAIAGKILNSDLELKGSIRNLIPYFISSNETVEVDGSLTAQKLDLNRMLENKNDVTDETQAYAVNFPGQLDATVDLDIKELEFRKFTANDITGNITIRDKKLLARPINFNAFKGSLSISGIADASLEDMIRVRCESNVKDIDIRQLFSQCENFGQNVLVDKNLNGYLTSEISFQANWNTALDVDLNSVYVTADVNIDKGELINYEPMKELSRFVKVSELEHIKFSRLTNTIEIKDQVINIPKMEVRSSALNIACSGKHTFDNKIDYHFKVLLNDLLAKKAKRAKKANSEFGVIEDDGLGGMSLYITMTGTVDDPIIKYDRRGAKEQLKENIKTEKQTIKQLLNEEFGWFKKDSLSRKNQLKQEAPKDDFIIKWNEEEEEESPVEDDDF